MRFISSGCSSINVATATRVSAGSSGRSSCVRATRTCTTTWAICSRSWTEPTRPPVAIRKRSASIRERPMRTRTTRWFCAGRAGTRSRLPPMIVPWRWIRWPVKPTTTVATRSGRWGASTRRRWPLPGRRNWIRTIPGPTPTWGRPCTVWARSRKRAGCSRPGSRRNPGTRSPSTCGRHAAVRIFRPGLPMDTSPGSSIVSPGPSTRTCETWSTVPRSSLPRRLHATPVKAGSSSSMPAAAPGYARRSCAPDHPGWSGSTCPVACWPRRRNAAGTTSSAKAN